MGSGAYRAIALILLGVFSKAEMPEDDFRIINRRDLLATDSDVFEDNSTVSFSQLLFDVARDQVLVGARDALYRLSLRGLRPLEKASWPAPEDKVQLCQDKGQTEEDCHNYVKVLQSYGHRLFACGTNAFSPVCSWREIESIGQVLEWTSGVANCPYSPHSNVTSILAGSGEYFAGTPTDFASSYTAICRNQGASPRNLGTLRSPPYDQNWLNEPQFVYSFEDDSFVYFLFREIAVEFMNCGKTIYSRIARVCKNDSGGELMMKDNWSTFLKARLNCSSPGEYPFYYDELQGAEYLAREKVLVASFTTNINSIAGSAICMYNMSDINAAFDGPLKVQASPTSTWEPKAPTAQARDHFRCLQDSRSHQSIEYLRYHLMDQSVQPINGRPIYTTTLQRFTHVTADVTLAKPLGKQFVVFVANTDNDILKLAVLARFESACLVEKWRFGDGKPDNEILSMQFVKDTSSVYLGTVGQLARIGAARCSRHSGGACLSSGDPHCGWDPRTAKCLPVAMVPAGTELLQDTHVCAAAAAVAVDGGWSSWSEPAPCVQENTNPQSTYELENPDMCMCRTRRCDNPPPTHGGLPCKGPSISVSSCTVHGGWSPWGAWSECSSSCGIGLKARRRQCASPEPRHGGRVCVGTDSQELYCSHLPPCPDPSLSAVAGGWSSWSIWSSCEGCGPSARRSRHRQCDRPTPQRGGAPCQGDALQHQPCDNPCELKRTALTTPWIPLMGNTTDRSYTEKRFKFTCKAATSEPIKLSITKEEERYCTEKGVCSSSPIEDSSDWGPWGPCSAPCGGGQQTRTRRCPKTGCEGSGFTEMLRACNTHACTGEWSCWSEWSECVGGSCSSDEPTAGRRTRTRMCLSREGCADAGQAVEKAICLPACAESEEGWGSWGSWSECRLGEASRRRRCLRGACIGPLMQLALCDTNNDHDNELTPMAAYSQSIEKASFVSMTNDSLSPGSVIACIVAAFVTGCLVCLAGVIYCSRRQGSRLPWRRTSRVPSSPHYITAKQNSYVTVPLKDVPRKAKRQPSFSGIGGGNGTLLSKANNITNPNNHTSSTTPKLYPKAIANEYDSMGTLRRHSNLPNNRNNLDYEEEKFY